MALALEILLHEPNSSLAADVYRNLVGTPVPTSLDPLLDEIDRALVADPEQLMFLMENGSLILVDRCLEVYLDMTQQSRETSQVLRGLATRRGLPPVSLDQDEFTALLEKSRSLGLIGPALHQVDWGHLRRPFPVCQRFGFSRGTPIDRYYLDRFLDEVREEVRGDVVEIGGKSSNREVYGFGGVASYRGFDVRPRRGVELVGRAEDLMALPELSFDTIVAFNVLEHCAAPWVVVENMRRWLRTGGKVLCMVPNIQRVHRMPDDYWRPLPAAFEQMFADWSRRKLRVYGNFIATIAALAGIASEELEPAELDAEHPDYPVSTCIVATK
jgi:Methyltransferase domain